MFLYNSATSVTITAGQQYHAVGVFGAQSDLEGLSFGAGSTGAITSTADNGGVLRCTDATHGLSTGDYICLHNMGDAAHVGKTAVTVIDVDTFDCDNITYNSAADTGSWSQGDYLQVLPGASGHWEIGWSASMSSPDAANKTFKLECVHNVTDIDEGATQRKFGIQNDVGVVASASSILEMVAGDRAWMQVQNVEVDTSDVSFLHAHMFMVRIK
jgi:hypothetical protein